MMLALMLLVAVEVPAVGCEGANHSTYTPAKALKPVDIATLDGKAGQQLAYYEYTWGLGVLAPRGWTCYGTGGSDGSSLAVSPDSAKKAITGRNWNFPGPAIMVSRTFGQTFGRFAVGDIIARFFPSRRSFYSEFYEMYHWKPDIARFAADKPVYVSDSAFEYVSPPGGLGARLLGRSTRPTSGVVMLVGEAPDLIHLAVRLPANLSHLAPAIAAQTKRHPWDKFEF